MMKMRGGQRGRAGLEPSAGPVTELRDAGQWVQSERFAQELHGLGKVALVRKVGRQIEVAGRGLARLAARRLARRARAVAPQATARQATLCGEKARTRFSALTPTSLQRTAASRFMVLIAPPATHTRGSAPG